MTRTPVTSTTAADDLRVITVRQPWAWALIHGGKDVENRVRNIAGSYRGPLAIHAALADADSAPEWVWMAAAADTRTLVLREPGKSLARWQPRGAVIGVVNLWAVHEADHACCPDRGVPPFGTKWAMAEHWHLCVSNPIAFADPIPASGQLGLWRPDKFLRHDIHTAMGRATPAA